MLGFLKYTLLEDDETAARYLQPPPGQDMNLAQRVKELRVLHQSFRGDIALLSNDPHGTVEEGLPLGQVRAGVLVVGGTTSDVILVRVDDPAAGKIWLIAQETVARVQKLYDAMAREQPLAIVRWLPAALTGRALLGMSLAQWLGWLLSLPLSWWLAWPVVFLLRARAWIRCTLRKLPFTPVRQTRLGMPLLCIVAILMHSLCVYLLGLPLLYRVYYFRLMGALLAGCCVWLVARLTERGFDHALNRARRQGRGAESILILIQRCMRVVLLLIAVLVALAVFGFDMTTTLAGLGIGGLALALGAQKTLDNLIGGISLLMDQAVHVGDVCLIGNRPGVVEDIGLRSLKLRTVDQNLLVVPNGLLAQMQFENMTARKKLLMNQTFSLRIETQVEQLRFVLHRVQSMLDAHPDIERGTSRIRVANVAGAAFELELFAYGTTGDFATFTTIRQDVMLKIAEIVEASGTRFAAPTQLTYLSSDPGVDAEKANEIVRHGG